MKAQLGWLREHVDLPEDASEVARRLVSVGLAVDGVSGEGADAVLDVDVTSNRPDCLSHVGLARELAASTGRALKVPSPQLVEGGEAASASAKVVVEAPDLCPRYAARVVRGVTVGPSPEWMARRLEACGVRPINVIVDVTNYVLLELGHPLHAFDLALLAEGTVVVRRARVGETLQTLDGETRTLDEEVLLIADAAQGIAVAGVMGGANTEIHAETRDVLLESAWFLPRSVRRASRMLGLKTEASHRFERGADLEMVPRALDRAAELLASLAGGVVAPGRLDVRAPATAPRTVTLRHARVRRVGGVEVGRPFVDGLLPRLGFTVASSDADSWTVAVPSFRHDVSREVDLIEEVLRHHGYDRIPATLPATREGARPRQGWEVGLAELRRSLVASGHRQAVTYAFGDPAALEPFADSVVGGACRRQLVLGNPLAENLSVLRTSLVPGLLAIASNAARRGEPDVRLFEEARIYMRREPGAAAPTPAEERPVVAVLATGRAGAAHFEQRPAAVGLLHVKGAVLDAVRAAAGRTDVALDVVPATEADAVPGCAPGAGLVTLDGRRIGWIGRIHPDLLQPMEIRQPLFAAEVDLTDVLPAEVVRAPFRPLSRFPRVTRDASVLVDRNRSYGDIIGAIRERFGASSEAFEGVELIDRYVGRGVPEDKVSLTFSVAYRRQDRTLRQEEVDELHAAFVALLVEQFGAELRA